MKPTLKLFFWPFAISLYFLSRLVNLKIIPIFTDEAIYTYWAQVALHDPANRFTSLEDGKQPLFIWLAAISQRFFTDPLIASRLVSVLAGFGSTIGIYLLSKELFNSKLAKIATLLYIILPFTLLYDRMALFDSLLTMFGIYSVLFTVKMVKEPKLDTAILNGFAIGLALITKSSGNFFLYLLPFSLILLDFKDENLKKKILKWFGLSIVTFFICQIIFNSLRLSPLFYIIARKNLEFIRSYSQVLENPFQYFVSNFKAINEWVISYVGILLFIIFAFGLFFGFVRRDFKVIYLSILIILPFTAELVFNKVLYPRFVLFYFPFIIIVMAYCISEIMNNFKKFHKPLLFVLAIALLIPAITSLKLISNPPDANIPDNDASQYLNDWPAGYGVKEVREIIENESKDGAKVYVGTEGTFGLFPYALKIYFFGRNNIQIDGFWPVSSDSIPKQVIDTSKHTKTFFVFNENQKDVTDPHLKFIAKYQKGKGNSFMRVYEVAEK